VTTSEGAAGQPSAADLAAWSAVPSDVGANGAGPIWRRLALGRAMPERAAHRRLDADWLETAWLRARVLVLDARGRVLVDGPSDAPQLIWLPGEEAPEGERIFLAEEDAVPYFAVLVELTDWPKRGEYPVGLRPADLREVGVALTPIESALLTQAVGVANWHREYRYGPHTGSPLAWQAGGWEGVTAEGEVVYPRTNPAIIVLVHDNVPGDAGRCLLGRNANWPEGRYSCLAGFVEPGEAAEAAVYREVAEETGVVIGDPRYVASQAWPLPASLMLGFYAHADPEQPVVVDKVELDDARWFTRGELRGRAAAGAPLKPPPLTPPPLSIAYELIAGWRDERI
jgi:NAD+ diphosphatase